MLKRLESSLSLRKTTPPVVKEDLNAQDIKKGVSVVSESFKFYK